MAFADELHWNLKVTILWITICNQKAPFSTLVTAGLHLEGVVEVWKNYGRWQRSHSFRFHTWRLGQRLLKQQHLNRGKWRNGSWWCYGVTFHQQWRHINQASHWFCMQRLVFKSQPWVWFPQQCVLYQWHEWLSKNACCQAISRSV